MASREINELDIDTPCYFVWGRTYDENILLEQEWSGEGLCVFPDSRTVMVPTRLEYTTVKLTLERPGAPPAPDLDGWQDGHEFSLLASPRPDADPASPDQILIAACDPGGDCCDFNALECPGGVDTWWRLRVYRRLSGAGEEHLIQAWIAGQQPVIRLMTPPD
ncbi:hypothetical protein [Streptomyces monashensis]|uniref:Uncharacterized protein n=1 Tax=Streptomyces monashensis TaxID=1678012 RepID=A0A1S2P932_9ACTN|nr:hypothetical protein [Streptomyces monashensis]OIJ90303.1 hypothetical protein BIV23_40730 [Streptomyces monashensis]